MRMLLLAAAALPPLAACQPVDTPGLGFGDAVRQNMMAQIIAPLPPVGLGPDGTDGSRIDGAMRRYEEGKVYRPVTPVITHGGAAPAVQQ